MDSPEQAAAYDAMDHQQVNEAFVQRLEQLGAHGRMLDLGTGPGDIPLRVCERIADARVFAVDLSESMLEIARRKLLAGPFGGRVTFQRMDVKDLSFEADSFDTVFSNTILHHLPEPKPMLAEAWRVLKPGVALLVRDLYRPENESQLEQLVAACTSEATAEQRAMFRASLKAAFTPQELLDLVDALGMTGVQVVIDTDRHVSIQKYADA